MKTSIKNLPESRVQLTVEVREEELSPEISSAYRRVARKYPIPGFRSGKVPPRIIDVKIGKEIVLDEMLKEALPIFYTKAIKDTDVSPISKPKIEIVNLSEKELVFNADILVMPKVELCDYKNLEIRVPKLEVTEDDIEQRMMILRERFSRLEPVKRKVKQGDFILVDYDVFFDNKKIKELSISDYMLEVDNLKLAEPLYKSVIGANLNEELETMVKIPDEHPNKKLAGNDVKVKLKVNEIKEKILPEVNDEFARESSQFEAAAELVEDVKKNILNQKEGMRKVQISEKVLEETIKQSKVDAPKEMIEDEANRLFNDFERSLKEKNLELDEYLKFSNTSLGKIKESMTDEARRMILTEFILDEIARKENIKVTEEDIDKEIRRYARTANQPVENYRKQLEQTNKIYSIIRDIRFRKTLKVIIDNTKVKDEVESKEREET